MPNTSKQSVALLREDDVLYKQVMVFEEESEDEPDTKKEKGLGDEDADIESIEGLTEEEDTEDNDADDEGGY